MMHPPHWGTHNPLLVALSLLVAGLSSYTAIQISLGLVRHSPRHRAGWVLGGGLVLGVGIWSMHFLGILAYRLPEPRFFEVVQFSLSILVAIVGSSLGLFFVSKPHLGVQGLLVGGLWMGAAISGMHYLGMASIRSTVALHFHPGGVLLSVGLGVLSATLGLAVVRVAQTAPARSFLRRGAGGAALGLSIPLMHYVGMGAVSLEGPIPLQRAHTFAFGTTGLVVMVVIGTLFVLGCGILSVLIDRELTRRMVMAQENARLYEKAQNELTERTRAEGLLRDSEARLSTLMNQSSVGIVHTDLEGRVTSANQRFLDMLGYPLDELLGMHVRDITYEEDLEFNISLLDRLCAEGTDFVIEKRYVRRDGTLLWVNNSVLVVRDGEGNLGHIVAFSHDISERKEAEAQRDQLLREAELAREEAEEANRVKAQFLAVMSHELRTPLNAIIGYTELLGMGISGPVNPDQHDQLRRITDSSRHLLHLIDEILTFSRIEAHKEEVRLEPVPLDSLLRSVSNLIRPLAEHKGLRFEMGIPEEAANMNTDVGKAKQILVNLLSNAVKFTLQGQVALRTFLEPEQIRFEISDTGIGIAPEHHRDIFSPFWQVRQSLTREAGGTGLGLNITHHFVEMLGGTIEMRSTVGVGTSFTVYLPLDSETHMLPSEEPRRLPLDIPIVSEALLGNVGNDAVDASAA